MERPIELVPAIRRLELRQVGCWEHLDLEFLPGLNIITEEESAWGKTTIFRAILHGLISTSPSENDLTSTSGYEQGSVSLDFMSTFHHAQLQSPYDVFEDIDGESLGKSMFRQLSALLEVATPTTCLLMEDEATAILDADLYGEAVKLLNSSKCQIICQIAHRLEEKDFPNARIYTCYMETKDKVKMKLQQAGCSGA